MDRLIDLTDLVLHFTTERTRALSGKEEPTIQRPQNWTGCLTAFPSKDQQRHSQGRVPGLGQAAEGII